MKAVKITIAAMSGLVAGVILGILFAPHKGSKTRRNIARKGGELTEDLMNKVHRFGEFINEKIDTEGVYKYFVRMGKNRT